VFRTIHTSFTETLYINQCETSRTYQQLTECLHHQDYYKNTHTSQPDKEIKIFIYIDAVLHNHSKSIF